MAHTITSDEINSIVVGTMIQTTIATRAEIANGSAHWSEPRPVTSIHALQDDIAGKRFICGYTQFGPTSQISFSVKEGEPWVKLAAPLCEDCGIYPADLPSKLCPGCEAYREHTAVP